VDIFGARPIPVVVGAPALGRYCVFGNLFVRNAGEEEPIRIDRHPSMSRHPTTPTLLNSVRDFNRGCTNCHSKIHGSNHPSGDKFLR
jgi:hypothetical protein